MAPRSRFDIPKINDPVFVEGRGTDGNGFVDQIFYSQEEVLVRFHNSNDVDMFYFDDFIDNWTDRFGGLWRLQQ